MSDDAVNGREEVIRLFMKHRAGLFAFALAVVRDFQFAEDVLQEVAVVVCEQWEDFKPGTNFSAWARQITRNKIYSMSRVSQRNIALTPEAMDGFEFAASRHGEEDPDRIDALRHCLQKLGEKARQIVLLRYHQGLDCSTVAQRLQSTAPAIHMALSRIRSRLSDCITARLEKPAS
jgi:RNA polymerase sigma-70 factor, ECF subfamily